MDPPGTLEEWILGPDREEWSAELIKLLAAAQEGGSTVAECLLAIGRIRKGNDLSWYTEWKNLAEASRERGDAALAAGHEVTARRNWLRAINYYNAALLPMDSADERRSASILAMQNCAHRFLQYSSPAGEVVVLPWEGGHSLQGYFLPARSSHERLPTVISIGEPGHRKEEFLFKLAPHARERGLSLLAVDLLGANGEDFPDDAVGRPNPETSISCVMDYLALRTDVDFDRVAILADGWGSSFVARAVANEPRLAAAVCDGGLWDLHERAFLSERAVLRHADFIPAMGASRIARNIDCPVLVTLGADGWLKADRASDMIRQLRTWRMDVTLKVFTAEETAAAQGHADNPSLANEFIFDWLVSRLARD
ncbi:dienelactone hydrolase [Bradyrhizobium manausense]|uniref:alpha/beta hydrolase family protein n=1 Tax=Bradyrhizobium TaxID=374 RepID=UPI001BA573A8|nr:MULTISPECIES: dienelactone hydrolase [Bradyrhizobium]MBR0829497.1 dienelactone hydrolase [Bradyrhizobium manausense]UVO33372.1 dienelactone hydrolase [Bradyrhizobium arachidis]